MIAMQQIKWCCLVFRSWYDDAGSRSFGILVDRDRGGTAEFIFQHRAIDRGTEAVVATDAPLSLVSDIRIVFCPWCGRRLGKWYAKHIRELIRPGLRVSIPELDIK